MVTYIFIKQNNIQRRHKNFKNVYFYKTGKVVVSARVISSDIRWRRILHVDYMCKEKPASSKWCWVQIFNIVDTYENSGE